MLLRQTRQMYDQAINHPAAESSQTTPLAVLYDKMAEAQETPPQPPASLHLHLLHTQHYERGRKKKKKKKKPNPEPPGMHVLPATP